MNKRFTADKVIDGFSCCFRQWKSAPIHCSKVHGYSLKFKVWFTGELDEKNWVVDFGFLKRSKTKIIWDDKVFTPHEWFNYMFDHSVIIAANDPEKEWFMEGAAKGILQLRIIPEVGCEMFAKLVYDILNAFVENETSGRASVLKVECSEHDKNSASYGLI